MRAPPTGLSAPRSYGPGTWTCATPTPRRTPPRAARADDWEVAYDNAKRRAGVCRYGRGARAERAADRRSLRGRRARHDPARDRPRPGGARHGHDARWRRAAVTIGCSGERCASTEAPRVAAAWLGPVSAGPHPGPAQTARAGADLRDLLNRFDLAHVYEWTHHGRPAAMHPNYVAELERLRAGHYVVLLPVGSRARVTVDGDFHGVVGRIVKRGRTPTTCAPAEGGARTVRLGRAGQMSVTSPGVLRWAVVRRRCLPGDLESSGTSGVGDSTSSRGGRGAASGCRLAREAPRVGARGISAEPPVRALGFVPDRPPPGDLARRGRTQVRPHRAGRPRHAGRPDRERVEPAGHRHRRPRPPAAPGARRCRRRADRGGRSHRRWPASRRGRWSTRPRPGQVGRHRDDLGKAGRRSAASSPWSSCSASSCPSPA